MSDTDYFEMNRMAWDKRTQVHLKSDFYDLDGFLRGNSSLREIELSEIGDIQGKRLLHLQCHFGLDTLSWARMGAQCTGVDISPVAIDNAREIQKQTGLEASFHCCNLYDFQAEAPQSFDIVFTSYGALCWLPDIDRWAQLVADNLAPGGTFYLVEFHPIYDLLSGFSYFTEVAPDIEEEGTYTENGKDALAQMATWAHPISSVVSALVNQGIQIQQLKEFPFSPYNCFENMEERQPGRYFLKHLRQDVPIVYSLKGSKKP